MWSWARLSSGLMYPVCVQVRFLILNNIKPANKTRWKRTEAAEWRIRFSSTGMVHRHSSS